MPSELAPRLSLVGLYVHDVPMMIDFYTKTLGFVVSEGACSLMGCGVSPSRGLTPNFGEIDGETEGERVWRPAH